MEEDIQLYINRMLDTIRAYGVYDEKVLDAMQKVPRHMFVPGNMRDMQEVYADHPLHIGGGQTISQPYTVAYMLELLSLEPGMKVLEIGAGSGWNAALIKHIVGDKGKVIAVEYLRDLAKLAEKQARRAGQDIEVVVGDGSLGHAPEAPYDRIIATCAAPAIPEPWKKQLKPGGIIIAPVGDDVQELTRYEKTADGDKPSEKTTKHGSFQFVPLRGVFGF